MSKMITPRGPVAGRAAAAIAIAVVLGLLLVASGGCSRATTSKTQAPMPKAQTADHAGESKKMMAMETSQPDIPSCYECSGKGVPPVVEGAATDVNGTQVVNIKIENGYYVPNKITAKAGAPVQVVVTGKCKDCVGKPKFTSLNKQIDIRKTGTGTMDLGVLAAGSYDFCCGMGATGGSITVQ